MSVGTVTWVFQHSEATGNDRLVLLAVADEADDDGTNAFPSIDTIARKARVPKRTVMRCLTRLEEAGGLIVHRPETRGRGHFNTYVIVMDQPDQKGATVAPFLDPEKARKGAQRRAAVPNASQTHRPIDPTTTTNARALVPLGADRFEDFWSTYPRKAAKGAARKAWPKALVAVGGDAQRIIDGAARLAADPNREERYTPHPATWLNAERWDDPPLPSCTGATTKLTRGERSRQAVKDTLDKVEQLGGIFNEPPAGRRNTRPDAIDVASSRVR